MTVSFSRPQCVRFNRGKVGWCTNESVIYIIVDSVSGLSPVRYHNLNQGWQCINTLRPRQNGRHFPDDNFRCIFVNENFYILIKLSLKFVPNGPINNIPALVLIMAWRRKGDKPLSEPMLIQFTDACMRHHIGEDGLSLRQWQDYPKANEVTLKDKGEIAQDQMTEHKPCALCKSDSVVPL